MVTARSALTEGSAPESPPAVGPHVSVIGILLSFQQVEQNAICTDIFTLSMRITPAWPGYTFQKLERIVPRLCLYAYPLGCGELFKCPVSVKASDTRVLFTSERDISLVSDWDIINMGHS